MTWNYVLWLALGPQSWGFWAALLALLSLAPRLRRPLRLPLVTASMAALITVLTPAGAWMIRTLETSFPRPAKLPRHALLVVLTGSERVAISAAVGAPQFDESAERMIEAAHLARLHPQWRLALVGGLAARTGLRDVDVLAMGLEELGVAPDRMTLVGGSVDTASNASVLAALLSRRQQAEARLILLTSASHMPRAMLSFRAVGLDPLPYPVDYRVGRLDSPFGDLQINPLRDLAVFDTAAHEWVGIALYRLKLALAAPATKAADLSLHRAKAASAIRAPETAGDATSP